MANLKSKHLKLGEKASMFYDPTTQVKILPGEIVEVSGIKLRSKKIQTALRHAHLTVASEDEIEAMGISGDLEEKEEKGGALVTNQDSAELIAFKALKVEAMRAKLIEEYELDEVELLKIKAAKKDELITIYVNLEATEEGEEQ